MPPLGFLGRDVEHPRRRPVEERDAPFPIDADDAGGYAREHGFGETPPRVELAVRVHQFVALRFELRGHPIEGVGQDTDFVVIRSGLHAHREIALGHTLGSAGEPSDGRNDAIGRP